MKDLITLYRNDNDGPRLIAEMIQSEFPKAVELLPEISVLNDRIVSLEREVRELRDLIPEDED